jgi:hypothetical protein
MLKIENTEVYGWRAAVRGMRNPLNSWDKSDSKWDGFGEGDGYSVGENDLSLMKRLVKAGSDHSKFMRMITVTCDITAPLYWWKEYDTYKVGTVANSCSTMHTIHTKELTLDDFAHDQLFNGIDIIEDENNDMEYYENPTLYLEQIIGVINHYRKKYLETKDKRFWYQIIQLLPSSFNQLRTVQLNYAVLRNIYYARKNHKLKEWHTLCEWIESLPYSELITERD